MWFAARWDTSNKIDGTNYLKVTVNNVSGGSTTAPPVVNLPGNVHWLEDYNSKYRWTGTAQFGIEERAWSDAEIAASYNSAMGAAWYANTDLKGFLVGEDLDGDPQVVQFPQGEGSVFKNLIIGGHQDSSPTWVTDANVTDAESSTRKFGRKSRQISWGAGAADIAKAYMTTVSLLEATDYLYDIWVYVSSVHASDDLYLRISPNTSFSGYCMEKQLDTGTDDEGTSYATGTWLHYVGVFRSSGAGAHYVGFYKAETNGAAVLLVDQIRIHKSGFESTHPMVHQFIDADHEDLSIDHEDTF